MDRRAFLGAGAVALAGSGTRVVATDDPAFGPLGSVDVSGATDAVASGDYAYVAVGEGFAVVDISDPGSPTVVAERREIETGSAERFDRALDLWVSGDRLLLGGPGTYDPQLAHGFALFDISDPTTPEQLAFEPLETPLSGGYYIHNLYLADGIAYLTGSAAPRNPLVMVDVTGDRPREVGRWSLEDVDPGYADVAPGSRSLHDVTVRDGIAYVPCWDAGTWIVDVSDPTAPTALASITEYDRAQLAGWSEDEARARSVTPPGNAHYTMVNDDGTLLGVGRESWTLRRDGTATGGPGGIDLYDVSTPAEPRHLSRIEAPDGPDQTRAGPFTSAHNFDFAGDVLYTSWYYGGVQVYTVADPSNPERIAWWQDSSEAAFWTADAAGGRFVATSADVSKILRENPPSVREAVYVFPGLTDGQPPDGTATVRNPAATDDRAEASADVGGPGFGVAAALAGLGGLVGRSMLGRGDEEDRI